MVTLRNADPRNFAIDFGQAAQLGLQGFQVARAAGDRAKRLELLEAEAARKEEERADLEGLVADITKPGSKKTAVQAAMSRLAVIDPNAARVVADIRASGSEEKRRDALFAGEQLAKMSVAISSQDGLSAKQKMIRDLANTVTLRGGNAQQLLEMLNMSEGNLDNALLRSRIMGQDIETALGRSGGDTFAKSPAVIVRNPDGSLQQEIAILNKKTGEIETAVVPIGGALVGRQTGELPSEITQRRIFEAGGRAGAKADVELETSREIAGQKKRGAAQEARLQATINEGFSAADNIPILNRSIELLNSVETGGIDRAKLAAKQFFGIEGADEAELSANLGKTVLSQLRSTFGAAFTEREGARLARIEAGFGKSVEGNKRLLRQTKRLMERVANRAIRAAEKSGDQGTADEIRKAMSFSLDVDPPKQNIILFDASGNIIQ